MGSAVRLTPTDIVRVLSLRPRGRKTDPQWVTSGTMTDHQRGQEETRLHVPRTFFLDQNNLKHEISWWPSSNRPWSGTVSKPQSSILSHWNTPSSLVHSSVFPSLSFDWLYPDTTSPTHRVIDLVSEGRLRTRLSSDLSCAVQITSCSSQKSA